MKKRWFWVCVCVAVLGVVAAVFGGVEKQVTVDTVTLTPQRVEQTVCCTGVVESATSTGVFVPVTCRIKDVAVSVGQRVEQGQRLATIDKDATLDSLSEESQRMLLAATDEMLTAPADGVVVAIKGVAGDWLEMGTPCVVLALQDELQIRIAIQEKDLPSLQVGMPVRISGDGFRQAGYAGTLREISASARTDAGTGTVVEGVVALQEEDTSLRLGLTAKATIVTEVTQKGLVIPYEAVESTGEDTYVYVLKKGEVQRLSLPFHTQVGEGLLLADDSLAGYDVILEPEQVAKHKLVVATEVAS